jgi:hypothetical protein
VGVGSHGWRGGMGSDARRRNFVVA